ncbi:hypothetical protein [Streptomyces sp. MNU89]|nr:hypothetical protein [Streptomyces sp. MNU89]MCC9742413.1 hypothetical protein [Streptomyces sp. MNU89]
MPEVSLDNFNGGDGSKDIAYDAIAFVPGDYDGLNDIVFPEADPNAPDVDFVAAQDAEEVPAGAASKSSAAAAQESPECATGRDGIRWCGSYVPLDEKKAASPKREGRASAAAGPVGWCANVNGAAM